MDLIDLIPLYPNDDEETVRERMLANVNENVDPDDPLFIDVRPLSLPWYAIVPGSKEVARLYDRMGTEVVAACTPLLAWGEYLDNHAESVGEERLAATYATGEVTFNGTSGTLIPVGTLVSVAPIGEDEEPPEFETTEAGTITGGTVTLAVRCTEAGSLGNVGAAAIDVPPAISGVTSVSNADETTGGTDVETDAALSERLGITYEGSGAGNINDYLRWARAYPGVGDATVIPLINGPGTVGVVISGPDGAAPGAGVVAGLQAELDPPSYQNQINGAITLPTTPVTVDSTAGARSAGIILVGTQLVTYTGITGTTFTGCTGGSGAIADNAPVSQGGGGLGKAPVGHHVVVIAAADQNIAVTANVEPDVGFSLDGASGTADISQDIEDAIAAYINSIGPGEEIVLQKVAACIVDVTGVHDCDTVQLNGSATNVTISATPPKRPNITGITLTEV